MRIYLSKSLPLPPSIPDIIAARLNRTIRIPLHSRIPSVSSSRPGSQKSMNVNNFLAKEPDPIPSSVVIMPNNSASSPPKSNDVKLFPVCRARTIRRCWRRAEGGVNLTFQAWWDRLLFPIVWELFFLSISTFRSGPEGTGKSVCQGTRKMLL